MELIRSYDRRIEIIEQKLAELARHVHGRDFALIKTVPGIGRILALTILFEVDRIDRFPTVKDFCSYSRLVKGSVASAGKVKGLCGGKMGNAYLRWAFGQAAADRVILWRSPVPDHLLIKRVITCARSNSS